MVKTLTDKCAEVSQLKDWLGQKECPNQSLRANEEEKVSCPMEIFHTAVICLTDNEYSNVYCVMV